MVGQTLRSKSCNQDKIYIERNFPVKFNYTISTTDKRRSVPNSPLKNKRIKNNESFSSKNFIQNQKTQKSNKLCPNLKCIYNSHSVSYYQDVLPELPTGCKDPNCPADFFTSALEYSNISECLNPCCENPLNPQSVLRLKAGATCGGASSSEFCPNSRCIYHCHPVSYYEEVFPVLPGGCKHPECPIKKPSTDKNNVNTSSNHSSYQESLSFRSKNYNNQNNSAKKSCGAFDCTNPCCGQESRSYSAGCGVPDCRNPCCGQELPSIASKGCGDPNCTNPCCGLDTKPNELDVQDSDLNDFFKSFVPSFTSRNVNVNVCGQSTCPYNDLSKIETVVSKMINADTFSIHPKSSNTIESNPDKQNMKNEEVHKSKTATDTITSTQKTSTIKVPCNKSTCLARKLIECPECGGFSVSGATCVNPNVKYYPTPAVDLDESVLDTSSQRKIKSLRKRKDQLEKPEKEEDVSPKRKPTRFVYNGGKHYTGVRAGHKHCLPPVKQNVPYNMGWLWNIPPFGLEWLFKHPVLGKRSLKPGHLTKTMEARIKCRRKQLGLPDIPELKMLVKKKKITTNYESSDEDEPVIPKPTLTIKKDKKGVYTICMHPLKDPKTLAPRENPYVNCTPMKFVFPTKKNKPEDIRDNDECMCHIDEDAQESSTESELDLEFTTPAGLIYPEYFVKKPNVHHVYNQYNEKDYNDPDLPVIATTIKKKNKTKKTSSENLSDKKDKCARIC